MSVWLRWCGWCRCLGGRGLGTWYRRVGWCYVCVSCESFSSFGTSLLLYEITVYIDHSFLLYVHRPTSVGALDGFGPVVVVAAL